MTTSWKQIVKPKTSVAAPPGWCLLAVENSFSTGFSGPSATWAWQNGKGKHGGQPPKGIAVPVFFSMKDVPEGHVVTWMPDGSIYSASDNDNAFDYHPNLQHLLDFYDGRLTLLGWTEYLGGTQIVKKGVKKEMVTMTGLNVIYRFLLGVPVTAYGKKNYLGKVTFDQAYAGVKASPTYKRKVAESAKTKKVDLQQLPTAIRAALAK